MRKSKKQLNTESYARHRASRIAKVSDYQRTPQGRLMRRRMWLRKYGITIEQYAEMYDEQMGGCAICGKQCGMYQDRAGLFVDHDHKTGFVRGLLCFRCNTGLGKFMDDPALLGAALTYLTRGKYGYPDPGRRSGGSLG
jgi:hypothetical protein